MTTVAATISITSAIVTPTSHGLERRTNKPVSAGISNAAAVNSAIRPYPCDVIIGALAALGEGQEPESTKSLAAMGGHSIALTLEAGVKKDSDPYTFVHP